jgi:transcriptional regulator with GAF, ATPase, and Fis domain
MLTDARGDIVNPADFDEYLKSPGSTVIARGATLEDSTRIFQTAQIIEALKGSYTQAEAAFKLGETPSTFSKKLVRLGIDADAYLLQRPSKTVCV